MYIRAACDSSFAGSGAWLIGCFGPPDGGFEIERIPLYFVLECKAMKEVTISSKNQIVVPREAREALGAGPGDKLVVIVCSNRTLALRKPKSYRAALRGLAKDVYPPDYVGKERGSWD
ncbi:MAG: AbrB/MazE/SpoVT family DNA-binding domain-containing protein [Candidatus Acidiferrales bacterium]